MTYSRFESWTNEGKWFVSFRSTIIALVLMAAYLVSGPSDANSQITGKLDLEIKAAFQGVFDPLVKSQKNNCEVQVTLRDAIDPRLIHATKTITFDNNSLTGKVSFSRLFTNEYYISIKTKNSIETFSREPVLIQNGVLNMYDFTLSKSQAYGDNMYEYEFDGLKTACVYVGDVNGDQFVDGTDYLEIDDDASNFVSGNVITDLTGDEFVDGDDLGIVEKNTRDFVQIMFPEGSVSGAASKEAERNEFTLKQNYPNPFNPSTAISFALQTPSDVKLSIFDMAGRELAVLVNSNLKAGDHSYNWNASGLSSGTYFYRLSVNGEQIVKQMQLVK